MDFVKRRAAGEKEGMFHVKRCALRHKKRSPEGLLSGAAPLTLSDCPALVLPLRYSDGNDIRCL